jgi:hypothetical protein
LGKSFRIFKISSVTICLLGNKKAGGVSACRSDLPN